MTLKNNRTSVLCPFKLYASFCSHRWIAIWVTVRKRTNWVLTSVTLTFDLWPWPLAWTSLLSMVITWQGPSHSISSLQKTDARVMVLQYFSGLIHISYSFQDFKETVTWYIQKQHSRHYILAHVCVRTNNDMMWAIIILLGFLATVLWFPKHARGQDIAHVTYLN